MKKREKTQRGLNVIEKIVVFVVVVAIGVILFPVISQYVANSKMQADMETARQLATVMFDVLADDKLSDNAVEHATPQLVSNMDGSDFKKAVYSKLEMEEVRGKTKKNVDGEALAVSEFYYTLSVSKNQIEIYYGGITEEYKIYPRVGSKLIQ